MKSGQSLLRITFALFALLGAGCSSSSSGGGDTVTVASAVQDLNGDPDGRTTLVTFSGSPAGITAANFGSPGRQTAQTATISGNTVTVVWDASLGTADQIRIVNLAGFSSAFASVTTTNATAPTITSVTGTQNPGLGGDEIAVQFAGPHVRELTAEDSARWTLEVNGNVLDLTGSTFDLDAGTQVLTITLGPAANLHAAFDLTPVGVTSVADVALAMTTQVGAATGDTTAPVLLGVTQRLDLDEYGTILDFAFNEALDPNASPALPNFGVTLPGTPTSVLQVMPSGSILRVGFNEPQVPGLDTINLTGLLDAHGNAFPNGPQAITATEPVGGVVNAYDVSMGNEPVAEAVSNQGGDTIVFRTTQALVPELAEDPASWSIIVDGNPVVMADQTLTYDFLGKQLTVELDFDMPFGAAFSITGTGAMDVDGAAFNLTYNGVVSGDNVAPTVTGAVQNRTQDSTGLTVDVTFSEDLDETSAETVLNWSATGGLTVLAAELLPGLDIVRLTLDGPAVPGDVTLTAQDIMDLAGVAMGAPQAGIVLTSTDVSAPAPLTATANAIEGVLNDTVVVLFSDDMVALDVEDPTAWTVESPVGNPFDTTGAGVDYNPATRTAVLEFDALLGMDFKGGDNFSVTIAGARDIGGNAIANVTLTNQVTFEANLPEVHTIWRVGAPNDEVAIYFTEPCAFLDDLYVAGVNDDGTRYVLRDNVGAVKANAADAVVLDLGLGVRVGFSVPVLATDTIDVIGLTDLAGNELFPFLAVPTVAADPTVPSLATGSSTFVPVAGERNDTINVVFDVPMSPFELLEVGNYSFNPSINLNQATFSFDGNDTVTITLDGVAADNLQAATPYDLSVVNVRSARGVARGVTDTENGIVPSGDVSAPDVLVGNLRIDPTNVNALIYESTEAIAVLSAFVYGNFQYQGSVSAIQAIFLTPRTVRVIFPNGTNVAVGQTVDMEFLDMAGNSSGVITRAITALDVAEPIVTGISAVSVSGRGNDYLTVTWDESVDLGSALDGDNYSVLNGGSNLDLTNAEFSYDSTTFTVRIDLPDDVDLDVNSTVTITITSVSDVSGNALSGPATPQIAVSGDSTAPSIANAFANLRVNPSGLAIDVLFDEEVDGAFASSALNWSTSGAASVTAVTQLARDRYRLTLSQALPVSGTISLATGLEDIGGNDQQNGASLTFTPQL